MSPRAARRVGAPGLPATSAPVARPGAVCPGAAGRAAIAIGQGPGQLGQSAGRSLGGTSNRGPPPAPMPERSVGVASEPPQASVARRGHDASPVSRDSVGRRDQPVRGPRERRGRDRRGAAWRRHRAGAPPPVTADRPCRHRGPALPIRPSRPPAGAEAASLRLSGSGRSHGRPPLLDPDLEPVCEVVAGPPTIHGRSPGGREPPEHHPGERARRTPERIDSPRSFLLRVPARSRPNTASRIRTGIAAIRGLPANLLAGARACPRHPSRTGRGRFGSGNAVPFGPTAETARPPRRSVRSTPGRPGGSRAPGSGSSGRLGRTRLMRPPPAPRCRTGCGRAGTGRRDRGRSPPGRRSRPGR